MYDFYKHPPETKQELYEWLTSWLEPCDEPIPLDMSGELFIPLQGFRRGFSIHTIYKSLVTNQYVWWVNEDLDVTTFPKERFDTMENLLESVVDNYYKNWKLTK